MAKSTDPVLDHVAVFGKCKKRRKAPKPMAEQPDASLMSTGWYNSVTAGLPSGAEARAVLAKRHSLTPEKLDALMQARMQARQA